MVYDDDKTPVSRQQLLDIERRVAETHKMLSEHVERDERINTSNAAELVRIHTTLNGQDMAARDQSQKLETVRSTLGSVDRAMGQVEGSLRILVADAETSRKLNLVRAEAEAKVHVLRAQGDVTEQRLRFDSDRFSVEQRTKVSIKLIALVAGLITATAAIVTIIVRGIYG